MINLKALCNGVRQEVEKKLQDKLKGDLSFPDYDEYSICRILPTTAEILGMVPKRITGREGLFAQLKHDNLLPASVLHRFVYPQENHDIAIVIVDSMSYDIFGQYLASKVVLDKNSIFIPLSSVFPTLTPTAMSSICTCSPPIKHGIFGREVYLPELKRSVTTTLGIPTQRSSKELTDELDLLKIDNKLIDFGHRGVDVQVHIGKSYNRILNILYGDCTQIRYEEIDTSRFDENMKSFYKKPSMHSLNDDYEILDNLLRAIKKPYRSQRIFFCYLKALGKYAHVFGSKSLAFMDILDRILGKIFNLANNIGKTYLDFRRFSLIITADHGVTNINPTNNSVLGDHKYPELYNTFLMDPLCNMRSATFFVKRNYIAIARDILQTLYGDQTAILNLNDMEVREAIYGTYTEGNCYQSRIGDLLMINKFGGICLMSGDFAYKAKKKSDHGGLSKEEMIVPFFLSTFGTQYSLE